MINVNGNISIVTNEAKPLKIGCVALPRYIAYQKQLYIVFCCKILISTDIYVVGSSSYDY